MSAGGLFLGKKALLPESQYATQADPALQRHFHPVIERKPAELAQPGD